MTVQVRLIPDGSWTKLGNDGAGKINSGWEINELLKKDGRCEERAVILRQGFVFFSNSSLARLMPMLKIIIFVKNEKWRQ